MSTVLRRTASELNADPEVRVIVLTGAGRRAFSAGGDLATLLPAALAAGSDVVNPDPATRYFSDVYTPIVASVEGLCLGGGLEILLGTDIRVVSSDATFGLPEPRWGLIAGAGSHVRLPRQVPWAVAMELLLTGERITADRAFSIGLVNRVVEPGTALDGALAIARRIAANGPVAVSTAKEIAVRGASLTAGFVLEHELNARVLTSDDAQAGVRAFETHDDPIFTGH
jgi:enoyl-CoA hydratase/carnithine racemase